MPEKPQPFSIEQLTKLEDHYARSLEVMNATIEANGSNLFAVPLEKARSLEGSERTVGIMDIGLYREMVCDLYAFVKIPQAQVLLEIQQEERAKKATSQADALQQLVENGYLSLEDYKAAVEPLRPFLPENVSVLQLHNPEESDEINSLRQSILERVKGLKLRGHKMSAFDELLKALTPESAYPSQALRIAIFPEVGESGERPTLSTVLAPLRGDLRKVGVDIVTNLASSRTTYWLGLYDGEDEIIGAPAKPPVSSEKSILEKIEQAGLGKKQLMIVGELMGVHSAATARSKREWTANSYPDIHEDIANSRLSSFLPFIREKLEGAGVYIHMFRRGMESYYYMSENEEPDPIPIELTQGSAKHLPRRSREANMPVTEHEATRLEIENKVREVTMGGLRRGNLIEDDDE